MTEIDIWRSPCLIAPSLICFDLCNLEQQVHMLEKQNVDVLHVDILDGHFSPSMPLGLDTVRQLRKKTSLPFDVHLMVTDQDFFVQELLDIGVQQLTFHVECEKHADQMLNIIRRSGVRAGVALMPATPLNSLTYIIEKCDVVLLMLINPGYAGAAGEKQVPYARRKIADLHEMIEKMGLDTRIELDGRISLQDIGELGGTMANIFVAGSTCINKEDIPGSFARLEALKEKREKHV